MPASIELTTLDNIKSYLGIELTDITKDTLLGELIDAVSEAIENYCHREFARLTRVEFYDGQSSPSILLLCRPAINVVSVHDDFAREFTAASLIPPENYVLYENEGILKLRYGIFSQGMMNVRIEYEAGYATVPAAVEQAAKILAAHFYTRAQSGADAITSESVGVYTVSYDTGEWPPQVRSLLSEFRETVL